MKRVITASCFIVFLIFISVFSTIYLKSSTEDLSKKLDAVYQTGRQGDVAMCQVQISEIKKEYDSKEKIYLLVIRSTPLETITEKMNSLESYLEIGEIDLFCIETKKLNILINHLWETEKVTFSNVF